MTLTRPQSRFTTRRGRRGRGRGRVALGAGRRFAVTWHLAWAVAAVTAMAALALTATPAPQAAEALEAVGAIGAAGLAGAILCALEGETGPLAAVVIWGLAGAGAALLTGGTGGPLAAWCLAPMAAGAAFGRPRLLGLGAAAGVGAAALAALGGGLMLLPMTPAPLATWLSLLALATIGLGFAAGLVNLLGKLRGDDARARETELSLREALDHQPQLLLAVYPGGRILEAFGEAPMGVSIHDLAGLNLSDLVGAEDRQAVAGALREASEDGAADLMFVPAHDAQGWCALSVRRLNDTRLVAAIRDARDQRQRETELEQARVLAEKQNAGKSRFLANMSHELRTPLNAIMGFSDIMRQRLFGPMSERYAEYADLIHESGAHLLELINDVLDMSKIEAERFELARESFDARDAIAAVLRLMRGQAERAGINLRGDLSPGSMEAEADRRAVKQIAFNLVANALKFTPRGGTVTVSARPEGEVLRIVVADTGVGISPEDLERLGKPFEQAGDAGQKASGAGLGLSLVRAFARLHGGDMTMESTLGEGTTVTVRLPVLLAAVEDAAPLRRVAER